MTSGQSKQSRDRAGVIAPPPLIFLLAFFLGWFARRLLLIRTFVFPAVLLAGLAVAVAGWAVAIMLRSKTHVDPYQPTTALVTRGPFAFTRNPIYLAMTLGFISASLWTGWLATLCFLPLAIAGLHIGVIRREERYLEAKFGEVYRAYCRRVRRWI